MKQTDNSLLFPLLMKALERCVSPRVYFIFGKVRIYVDIKFAFKKAHRFL